MDLRDILKEAGIEDKVIKQILTTMKAEKIYTTSEENADIRIKKYKEKQESLEAEIKENKSKLDNYKKLEEEKETLSKEIENIKKEASEKEFNTALENAFKEAKIKDSKLVKALLDNEKIKLNEGKLEGLNEQLKSIKKDYDYLFEKPVAGIPDFQTGGKPSAGEGEKSIGEKLAAAKAQSVEIKY